MKVTQSTKSEKKVYETPVVVELGSLHGLTQIVKVGPNCDVTCFHNTSAG